MRYDIVTIDAVRKEYQWDPAIRVCGSTQAFLLIVTANFWNEDKLR